MAAVTKYFTAEEKRLAANRSARKWDNSHRAKKAAINARWAALNPDKVKASMERYKKKHPDRVAAHNRASNWRTNKLNTAACWAALNKFSGFCGICGCSVPPTKHGWVVDHCHKTLEIRGILCHHCNMLLGNAHDDPRILLAAVEYLRG